MALALGQFLHGKARPSKFVGKEEAQRPHCAATMMVLRMIPGHSSNQMLPLHSSQLLRDHVSFVPVESLMDRLNSQSAAEWAVQLHVEAEHSHTARLYMTHCKGTVYT